MRILVVDDHALFREGLRLLLAQMDRSCECEVADSALEGLRLARARPFDVVLLDWHMEGLSREPALRSFREAAPTSRLIVVSGEKTPELVRKVIDGGGVGFIPKESSPETLQLAMRTIASGGIYLPAALLSGTQHQPLPAQDRPKEIIEAFPALTQRQADVLAAILRGLPNKLIARELGISDTTVKTHLSAIFRELSVRSRTEAVYMAARQGIRIA